MHQVRCAVSLHRLTLVVYYFLVIHHQLLCTVVDLVKRLWREYYLGTLSSLITLPAFLIAVSFCWCMLLLSLPALQLLASSLSV